MPSLTTRVHARRLSQQLPALPAEMKDNDGRELARYAFVIRTLEALRTGGTITGDRSEDWRRVTRQLTLLWQMGDGKDFRLTVAGLALISEEAQALEPAPAGPPAGTGPRGGDLVFPWQARADDWISVPGGLAGPLVETSMAMPDLAGIAKTALLIGQEHRFHPGGPPHVSVLINSGSRVERLDATKERARAREQWESDRRGCRGRQP
ncbi:hypothetical protein OG369_39235 [Streptomyces sp. NBC_01221]|uniref:hypothetical protein n=1 Tax=Streptomyces sp. NBC_01221 TaxID=2903782 RepID=UPI0022532F03|nr:hypothetical protein [Streptomyces sp. NBC_01221]MCX4791894.1 hypothetical protein [Streptomyces sp. NBC_01221]